jgi:large subunit ribosomal protein LP0
LIREFNNLLIVSVDNVGSNQMQKIRLAIRGMGTVLMGKNTIMRKVLREEGKTNPKLLALLPFIVGNVGFVFTNGDLNVVRQAITTHKVPAAARAGSTAPTDVFVPPGPTGMDPGQTAFFQALNIATKIQKGSIEIINTVHLIKAGEKVTSSAVALLSKLDLKPFFYGMIVNHVYEDGFVYAASVLDLTKEDLFAKFFNGVHKITALSLEIGYPTMASLPQHFARAMEKLYALSLATEYEFEESKKLKDILANPGAFVAASAPAASGGGGGGGAKKPVEAKKEEPEPEEEEPMAVGGLFGDD